MPVYPGALASLRCRILRSGEASIKPLSDPQKAIVEILNQQNVQQRELWIGLVELKPLNREAYKAAGAFTNIVTWARDAGEFRSNADVIAETLNMYVMDVEEVEPMAERMAKCELAEDIADMVLRAESNPNAIIYGTLHTYPFDEA